MTPAKRRRATPASDGPARVAPDVPTAPPDAPVPDELVTAPVPPADTTDGTELLGPDGEPIPEGAPAESGQVGPEGRTTTESPQRPLSLYPLPVWPD